LRDELRDDVDDERIRGQRERSARATARLTGRKRPVSTRSNFMTLSRPETAQKLEPIMRDSAMMRHKNDTQPRPECGFRGIDAPRDDRGNALERGCDAAVEIGTAARMDVHDVRLDGAQRSARAGDQGQVEVARHRYRDDLRIRAALCELTPGRTEQYVVYACRSEAAHEVADLGAAAIEMAA
jgi:hypothetical protein